ncbi:MAG: carbohydrate ABC transporter permease [Sphaerochaetaceae bacterium]|nr:carbohydrate ABC transporter permease [Sphaerochaetaceae bacterium]
MRTGILNMTKTQRTIMKKIGFYTLLAIIIFAFVFPFIWMVTASFKTQAQIQSTKNLFIFEPTLDNYKNVFFNYNFTRPIVNSAIVALTSTFIALLIGLPASYGVARFGLHKLGGIVLIIRFFPGITFLIPWFTIFNKIGLTDTHIVLILSHLFLNLPFIIWLMVPFFEHMPRELEDSARVDGCSVYGTLIKINLPLAVPGIITASLLSIVFSWNNLVFSMVLSGMKTKMLPMAILNFITYALIDWGALMAASVIITIPILAFSFITQRYIIQGLTAGAVKG